MNYKNDVTELSNKNEPDRFEEPWNYQKWENQISYVTRANIYWGPLPSTMPHFFYSFPKSPFRNFQYMRPSIESLTHQLFVLDWSLFFLLLLVLPSSDSRGIHKAIGSSLQLLRRERERERENAAKNSRIRSKLAFGGSRWRSARPPSAYNRKWRWPHPFSFFFLFSMFIHARIGDEQMQRQMPNRSNTRKIRLIKN